MSEIWNPERAGTIILHDVCKGDRAKALQLLADTLVECEKAGVLNERGAEQVAKLIEWVGTHGE